MPRKDELTFEQRKELKRAIEDSPFYNPHEKMPKLTRELYESYCKTKEEFQGDRAQYRTRQVQIAMANRFGGIKAPQCDICQKMVESFSMDYSPEKDEVHWLTECHGATQLFYRDFESLRKTTQKKIAIPKAFKPNQGDLYEGIIMTKLRLEWETAEDEYKRKEDEFVDSVGRDVEKMDPSDFDAIKKTVD